jgi:hypothetical protein
MEVPIMEWMGSVVAVFVLLLLVVPAIVAVGSVLLLGAAGWMSYASPSLARTRFSCPFSNRSVTAAFVTRPGSEQPSDVVSCSLFKDERAITCKKGCLQLMATGWSASPMAPRYALLSGDVALRPVAGHAE